MKSHNVLGKSLKITIIYFVIGCAWILLSDKFVQATFPEQTQILFYSITKGFLYVFITSILIFGLIYPALKKELNAKEVLRETNRNLEQSNILYKNLCQDYNKKQALLKSLINSIPNLIFYKDTKGFYLGCNKAFEAFVGKTEQEIIKHTDLELFPSEEAELFRNIDQEMLKTNTYTKNEEHVTYPDGSVVFLETLKTPYFDSEGNIVGLIGISQDITERKVREEKMLYMSRHDALTGIYNRTYFDEEKISLDCDNQLPLSIIVGNINGMKLINDAFGHHKGDRILQEITSILTLCVREGDIAARTGGDEFSILMPHTDEHAVKMIADHIRALCKEKRQQENSEFNIDIALGYATKSKPSDSLDKVMILAEDLMYKRKLLEQRSLHSDYLSYIKTTMFEKSYETEEHAERLVQLSKKLGAAMGLSENEMDELELVAMLHDVGKISIDKNILTKADHLTDAEWLEMKKHPEVGYKIANSTSGLSHVADYILCHHEHWDGSGYPLGLSGTDIPLISRIIAVVDAYDAMTQDRAYRKALPEKKAVEEILSHKGTQFDPEIADTFVEKVLLVSK